MNNNYHTQLKNNPTDTGILNEVATNNQILYHQNNMNKPRTAESQIHLTDLGENEIDSVEDPDITPRQSRPRSQSQSQPQPQPQPQPQSQPQSQSQPNPQSQMYPQPYPQSQPQRGTPRQMQPQTYSQSQFPPQHQSQPQTPYYPPHRSAYQNPQSPEINLSDSFGENANMNIDVRAYLKNKPIPKQLPMIPPVVSTSNSNSNYMTEYGTMTVVLMVTFIILVHPSTSVYLDKYLPSITDLKGCIVRAFILGIVYIITKIIMTYTKKN